MTIIDRLIRLLTRRGEYRKGHIHGPDGTLYMERFALFETRWLSARVHHIVRPDMDRHMHDHPAPFLSLVLKGWYREARPMTVEPCFYGCDDEIEFLTTRKAGSIAYRPATERHRITMVSPGGVWTVFVFIGGRRQWWGFFTPAGKVHWQDYIDAREREAEGRSA